MTLAEMEPMISVAYSGELDVCVETTLRVEAVVGADKLFKLTVDRGYTIRTVLPGIEGELGE